jgi:hypothetical protein
MRGRAVCFSRLVAKCSFFLVGIFIARASVLRIRMMKEFKTRFNQPDMMVKILMLLLLELVPNVSA